MTDEEGLKERKNMMKRRGRKAGTAVIPQHEELWGEENRGVDR